MASRRAKGEARKQMPSRVPKSPASRVGERAIVRTVLRPSFNHALTATQVLRRSFGERDVSELTEELSAQCAAVSGGNMARPEALLTAQAHTLDALFNDLTRLAYGNWNKLEVAERLLRLAFKAQTQSRATVETLGNLRNPPMVIARQANITQGPQQVNNGEPAPTRKTQFEPNKLLEHTHVERLDTGTTGAASGADSRLEAVGALDRSQDC